MTESLQPARRALVWGAAGDIGSAVVEQLRADGWTVGAVSRNAAITSDQTAHHYEANVADPFAVQQVIMALSQEFDAFDLFVYAAGDIVSEPLAKMTPAIWQRILDANLNGAYLTAHYSLPLLAQDAPLVFIGAVSERLRLPGLTAYVAAKAGLEALVEALRKEERKRRVVLLRPGAVNTGFWEKVPFRMPANALQPQEVAAKIVEAYGNSTNGVVNI
jgi:NAD(P)-dependent dehydrogenase (short-subunit alcohol dehydrogenase family)